MLKLYGEPIPKDMSTARREVGVLSIKWMVEKRMEEHEEVKQEQTMGDGRRR